MKIIRFKPKTEFLMEFLKRIEKQIEENGIDNLMICCKDKRNREMYTAYFNLDQRSKNGMRRAYTSRHNGPNGSRKH